MAEAWYKHGVCMVHGHPVQVSHSCTLCRLFSASFYLQIITEFTSFFPMKHSSFHPLSLWLQAPFRLRCQLIIALLFAFLLDLVCFAARCATTDAGGQPAAKRKVQELIHP